MKKFFRTVVVISFICAFQASVPAPFARSKEVPRIQKEGFQELRQQINHINLELLRLLNERAKLVIEIGRIKREMGMPYQDSKREEEILEVLREVNRGPFPDSSIENIFRKIFETSIELQKK